MVQEVRIENQVLQENQVVQGARIVKELKVYKTGARGSIPQPFKG